MTPGEARPVTRDVTGYVTCDPAARRRAAGLAMSAFALVALAACRDDPGEMITTPWPGTQPARAPEVPASEPEPANDALPDQRGDEHVRTERADECQGCTAVPDGPCAEHAAAAGGAVALAAVTDYGEQERWDLYKENLAAEGSRWCEWCQRPHHEDEMCPEDER